MVYLFIVLMTLLGALGAFYFKKSTGSIEKIHMLIFCPAFYIGGVLYVISAVLNILVLRHMDYSIAYPMTAITYVWSLILAHFLLKEEISEYKISGIILILLGVVLLAL